MSNYGAEQLKKYIEEIDELLAKKVSSSDESFRIWKTLVERFIQGKYGKDSSEYNWFKKLRFSGTNISATRKEYIEACAKALKEAKGVLSVYLSELEEEANNKVAVKENEVTMINSTKEGQNMNNKKKYQVFISSTYEDLKDERLAVTQCLLDNRCIPVGMEQFPASGMSQMEYIQKMLDDCDYYILILAGRYGSLADDGIGYTEKEYDYAKAKGIPILSFVREDINELPIKKCEETVKGRQKLEAFRTKVRKDLLVKYYNTTDGLKAAVATAINQCIKDIPTRGWVRGNLKDTMSEEDIEKKLASI